MRILAGDIGGTNTRLRLLDGESSANLRVIDEATFNSRAFATFDEIAVSFLRGQSLNAAALAVAGPVHDNRVRTTNLPWLVDGRALASQLAAKHVAVINDFHAVVLGIETLGPNDLHVLNDAPADPAGPRVVIGAGTGLGEAVAMPTAAGLIVLASEGGHADFAPRNDEEVALLHYLATKHGRVSVERAVSGPGLHSIYEYLVTTQRFPELSTTRARMRSEEVGSVIGSAALDGSDPACVHAVNLFLDLYGAEAGNFALKVLPKGGLFVAGGIASRLLPLLPSSRFLESFLAKGRMRPLLEATRVSVVLRPDVGLLGAAARAATLAF